MPGMDGYETIQQLRAIKKLKYTPIVFLSGNATAPNEIESGFLYGSSEYWTKPIAMDEFIVRVQAVLRVADAEKQLRKLQQSFNSMVVHDLRNPIGGILGMSEYLMEEKELLSADHFQMATEINTLSRQLLQIVKDLLELTQFESGEYHLQRTRISMFQMVTSAIAKVHIMRNQKKIDIEVDVPEDLHVLVDGEYFGEVIDNLLDNALRYTPAHGKITIRTRHVGADDPEAPGSIIFEMIDTGCGIADEEIATLFDKSRITNATFRKANTRTGLGLAVCREIMEAHDGTITVETKVDQGSTFVLTLPL
jgi:two-component system sensor histidine kinase ResE